MIDLNFEYIEDLGYESVGDAIIEPRPMRLGHPIPGSAPGGDDINVPITISGQPGFVWTHNSEGDTGEGDTGDSQSPSMALNSGRGKIRKEELVWGSHILVAPRSNGKSFIVMGLDADFDAEFKSGYNPRPQSSIDLSQFDNMLLQPVNPPDMRAIAGGGKVWWQGQVWMMQTLFTVDWTAYIPATPGMAVAYSVERDPANFSNPLIYEVGAEFASTLSDQIAYNSGYLPQPSNSRLFYGWIKLINGMTKLQHVINIITAQQVITHDYLPLDLSSKFVIGNNRFYVAKELGLATGGGVYFDGTGKLFLL